jgi:hypothetical protein
MACKHRATCLATCPSTNELSARHPGSVVTAHITIIAFPKMASRTPVARIRDGKTTVGPYKTVDRLPSLSRRPQHARIISRLVSASQQCTGCFSAHALMHKGCIALYQLTTLSFRHISELHQPLLLSTGTALMRPNIKSR